MDLYLLPLLFILIGLAMYTVLGGADFGAGAWQLTARAGAEGTAIRDHAHHALGPVWEANHVWLVFVLTVAWTSYPVAFGSIASTLSVPLFIAAVGIILRGASYALRSGTTSTVETRSIDTAFGASSVLTPFALGTVVGAIASRRVPVGNAAGNLITSWVNPTSLLIGALAVVTGAYLAAVYLAADAVRSGEPLLARAFRARALLAGLLAGALAVAGLAVLHSDASVLYRRLVHGAGLAALIVSGASGIAAVALVWRRRYEPARYAAALAVSAIIAGWAIAQSPTILPGLTVSQAAAPHDTLVLVVVAVLAGAAILFPSLAVLFGLVLHGRFDPGPRRMHTDRRRFRPVAPSRSRLLARSALAGAIAAIGLLAVADAPWLHAVGVVSLLAAIVLGFGAVRPTEIAHLSPDDFPDR
jgi:cytochrome d ubiquinol oxidase subunit II